MMQRLLHSSLFRSAGIYTVANVFNAAVPFLLLPVLTRFLTPEDFGTIATFQVLVNFLIPLIGLSMTGAITRQYYEKDQVDFPVYFSNCLFILSGMTLLVVPALLLLGEAVGSLVEFPSAWLWSAGVVTVFQILVTLQLTLWQVKVKPVMYGLFQNGFTIANLSLSLFFVIQLGMNWQGRIVAQLVSVAVFGMAALALFASNKLIRFSLNMKYVKHALRFGLPMIPYAMTGWVIGSMDRIFINTIISVSQTGLYAAAFQITSVISFVQVSFNNAWTPWLFEQLKSGGHTVKRKIVLFSYGYIAGNALAAFLLVAASPWFLSVFLGPQFQGTVEFIFWLALAQAANSVHYITVNYIFYHNKTVYLSYEAIIMLIIHIPLTYLLISFNGAIGAAQALFISNSLTSGITFFFATKTEKMPWLSWRSA